MNLDDIRAAQHNNVQEPADAALSLFLHSLDYRTVQLDYAPSTALEARILAHTKRDAA